MEAKYVRGHNLKNEVILNIPANLYGYEWRVTAGQGMVNIQRRSFLNGGKYRIMMRMPATEWLEFVKVELDGKPPVEIAKALHKHTGGRKSKWTN